MSKPNDFDFYCDVALQPDADITKVLETDRVLAFNHTKPFWETHIVIIPKTHIWDVRHVDDPSLFAEIFEVAQKILRDVSQEELDVRGAKILTNIGKFQDTPHLHFHLVMGEMIRPHSSFTVVYSKDSHESEK